MFKNISYATLSGANDFNFDPISDLISSLSFSIKKIALANRDRREVEDAKNAKEIIDTTTFVPFPDPFEQEVASDKFEDLEHKKVKHAYVEPQDKDGQTIETERQAKDNEFSKLKQEFDKVNNAVTEQKSQGDVTNLIDNILDEDSPFKNIDTEDIWIKDGLFGNDDRQDIKDISKYIIDVNDPFVDIIQDDFKSPIETITIDDGIDIPSDDGIATDALKKIKIITDPNRLCWHPVELRKNIFVKNQKAF